MMVAALAGVLAPGLAVAQEPSADEREREALAYADAGDDEGSARCGDALLQLYNDQAAAHAQPDRLLHEAARCFDGAGALGQATQARTALLERYPTSEFAQATLFDLAERYADIAEYADAAARYEQFAAKYGEDDRAKPALENAYLFRVGLSDNKAARADLDEYERLYEHEDQIAAGVFWSRHDLLDSAKQRRQHAIDYLAKYGEDGGIDRMVVAEVVIAQYDWRRSCPEPLLLDACVSVRREPTRAAPVGKLGELLARARVATAKPSDAKRYRRPKRCPGAANIVTVHTRNAKLAAAAQERFAKTLKWTREGYKEIERFEQDRARVEAFKGAWAAALFYRADRRYEEFLQIELPDELVFVVEKWRKDSGIPDWERKYAEQIRSSENSRKRLGELFERKSKLGREIEAEYLEIKSTGSPHWILAAALRLGSMHHHFAEQLLRAEVPSSVRTEVEVDAYCDVLADSAQPVLEQAIGAWTYCIERSTEYGYFNEFSRACEAEANLLAPRYYPKTYELFGESVYAGTGIQSTGVLADPGDFIDPSEPEQP